MAAQFYSTLSRLNNAYRMAPSHYGVLRKRYVLILPDDLWGNYSIAEETKKRKKAFFCTFTGCTSLNVFSFLNMRIVTVAVERLATLNPC